jgi:hypothetical protein
VLICGLLTVALILFFSSADRPTPEGTPGVMERGLAFPEGRVSDSVRQWTVEGFPPLRERYLWIDFLFPCAYADLPSSLLPWVAKGWYGEWRRGLVVVLALPLVAGLLDRVENVLLLILLGGTSSFSTLMILGAAAISEVEWVLRLTCA